MDTVRYSLETVTDEPLIQTLTLVSHPQRETVMMNLSTEALAETVQAFCHLTERVADGLRTHGHSRGTEDPVSHWRKTTADELQHRHSHETIEVV